MFNKRIILIITSIVILLSCNKSNSEEPSTLDTTAIPDANFEQALIDLGYDSGTPNGKVLTSSIISIDSLTINMKKIKDLTGIENFSSLVYLSCFGNELTNLDVTHNSQLTYLDCSENYMIDSIDVTHNSALLELNCSFCNIVNLNLTQNRSLYYLNVFATRIANLNLSENTALTYLDCTATPKLRKLDLSHNTALSVFGNFEGLIDSLDFSQNKNIEYIFCGFNNELVYLNLKNGNTKNIKSLDLHGSLGIQCVQVDDAEWAQENLFVANENVSFSTNCGN